MNIFIMDHSSHEKYKIIISYQKLTIECVSQSSASLFYYEFKLQPQIIYNIYS
jgi:hypothetical protein